MPLIVVTPPEDPALDRDGEVKQQLGRDASFTLDDDYLAGLIEVATDVAQKHMARALIDQGLKQTFDGFPGCCGLRGSIRRSHLDGRRCHIDRLELLRSPVSAVTAVKYLDLNDQEQTVDPSLYKAVLDVEPTYIRLKQGAGAQWPIAAPVEDSVWVEYTAGYGDEAADVPEAIRQGMKLLVHHWYENRLPIQELKFEEMPMAVTALFDLNRVWYA